MTSINLDELNILREIIKEYVLLLQSNPHNFTTAYEDDTLSKLSDKFLKIFYKIEEDIRNTQEDNDITCDIDIKELIEGLGSLHFTEVFSLYGERVNNIEILNIYYKILLKIESLFPLGNFKGNFESICQHNLSDSFLLYLLELKRCLTSKYNVACSILLGILSELAISKLMVEFVPLWDNTYDMSKFDDENSISDRFKKLNDIYRHDYKNRSERIKVLAKQKGLNPDDIKIFTRKDYFDAIINAAQMARIDRNPRIHPIYLKESDVPEQNQISLELGNLFKAWKNLFEAIEVIKVLKS